MDLHSDSPLARMVRTTTTDFWTDSCSTADLEVLPSPDVLQGGPR